MKMTGPEIRVEKNIKERKTNYDRINEILMKRLYLLFITR